MTLKIPAIRTPWSLVALLLIGFAISVSQSAVLASPASETNETDVCANLGSNNTVAADTVWTAAGSPYVVNCDVRIAAEASSLIIEAGVEVRFGEDRRMRVEGPLTIAGSKAGDVIFTSNQPEPSVGYWRGVEFSAGEAPVSVNGLTVRYAGRGSSGASILIKRPDLSLDNVTVERGASRGVYVERVGGAIFRKLVVRDNLGPGIEAADSSGFKFLLTLVDCTLEDNQEAVKTGANIEVVPSGTIASGNKVNGIVITGSRVELDTTWHGGDLPIVIDTVLTIESKLSIEPGTIVKFASSQRYMTVRAGSIQSVGTSEQPVYITSLVDDAACNAATVDCDTNGDGAVSKPDIGNWQRIELTATSKPSLVEHTIMRYGGAGSSTPMLHVRAPGFVARNSHFSFSKNEGLMVDQVPATVENCDFEDNGLDAIRVYASTKIIDVSLTGNRFKRNAGAAISTEPNALLAVSGNQVEDYSNGINGILVKDGRISRSLVQGQAGSADILWSANELPWVVARSASIDVDTEGTLVIQPGAVVKMSEGSSLQVAGTLRVGAANAEVRALVTALTDDACDAEGSATNCDTNGDGALTSPLRGYWGGITIDFQAKSASFYRSAFRYGGTERSRAMIELEHDKDRIVECEVSFSGDNGIETSRAPSFHILGNDIHDNKMAGVMINKVPNGVTVFLEGNNIHDNEGAAIEMDANAALVLDDPDYKTGEVPNVLERNQYNGAAVSGDITSSRRWSAGSIAYLITDDIEITQSKVLTIEPGAVIKLANANITASGGALIAVGTEDAPIIFTSINDDDADGRDSNPRDGAISPQAGDWEFLSLGCSGTCSKLDHVIVRYAGGRSSLAAATILMKADEVVVSNATITDGSGAGVQFDGISATLEDSTIQRMSKEAIEIKSTRPAQPTLRNNTIEDNRGAVIKMDASSEPNVSGTRFKGNAVNGILVSGSTAVRRLWRNSSLPYVVEAPSVGINASGTIEIQAGTVVKFQPGAGIEVRRGGTLLAPASGSTGSAVIFTSIRDDSACTESQNAEDQNCDTANDGSRLIARPGDWKAIDFQTSANGMRLSGVTVRYGGRDGKMISLSKDGGIIENSLIERSLGDGIYTSNVVSTITGNSIRDNIGVGLKLVGRWSGTTTVENNNFTGNQRSVDFDGVGQSSFAANVAIGNEHDAMLYCSPVTANQVWVPDLVREIDCTLQVDARLQLDPGTVLQFGENDGIRVENQLDAEGVVFTTSRENAPPGDWNSIVFGSRGGGSIRHSLIWYGGQSANGAVDIATGNAVKILNNLLLRTAGTAFSTNGASAAAEIRGNIVQEIQGTSSAGLRASNKSLVIFEDNRLSTFELGVSTQNDAQPTIRRNSFSQITKLGVDNRTTDLCLDAQRNWWGDATGPQDSSDNSREACGAGKVNRDGKGIPISDHVDYSEWLSASPPSAPALDTMICGVTNRSEIELAGLTSPNAKVHVFDKDGAGSILSVDANDQGRFTARVPLSEGEHRLSFEARAEIMAGAQRLTVNSPRTSFRRLMVQRGLSVDPLGIRFVYGPSNELRLQPLRDVTGCATGCGGPTSGRVTLPSDATVQVRVPVAGNPSKVVFSQPGQPDRELSSRLDYWETAAFAPVPGSFTIKVDGSGAECMGFVYLGEGGVIFTDTGIVADPVRSYDFERGTIAGDWVASGASWAVISDQVHSGSFAITDSPAGNYGTNLDDYLTMVEPIDLIDVARPELTFWHKYRFSTNDSGSVEISTNGSSWSEIVNFKSTRDEWVSHSVSLEKYTNEPSVQIRFKIKTDGSATTVDDGWYIDDIAIGPGGAGNGKYDPGESVVDRANVTLLQRDPNTGRFVTWDAGPTEQSNPQTSQQGSYGFYNLSPGEYRLVVDSKSLGVIDSGIIPVWDGTLSIDIPLVGRQPIYIPVTYKNPPSTPRPSATPRPGSQAIATPAPAQIGAAGR